MLELCEADGFATIYKLHYNEQPLDLYSSFREDSINSTARLRSQCWMFIIFPSHLSGTVQMGSSNDNQLQIQNFPCWVVNHYVRNSLSTINGERSKEEFASYSVMFKHSTQFWWSYYDMIGTFVEFLDAH